MRNVLLAVVCACFACGVRAGDTKAWGRIIIQNTSGSSVSLPDARPRVISGGTTYNGPVLNSWVPTQAAGTTKTYVTASGSPNFWFENPNGSHVGLVSGTNATREFFLCFSGDQASCLSFGSGTVSGSDVISGVMERSFVWNGTIWTENTVLYTNYVGNFGFTNTTGAGGYYEIQMMTNGVAAGAPIGQFLNSSTNGLGDAMSVSATNPFGPGVDFDWVVTGPGGVTNDFQRVAIEFGSATGTAAGTPGASSQTAPVTRTDPFSQIPQYTPSTTNSLIADRQNAQGIVEAIGKQSQQLLTTLQGLGSLGAGTNGVTGPGITNDYSEVLARIQTNTLSTALQMTAVTNLLTAATNILDGMTNGGVHIGTVSNANIGAKGEIMAAHATNAITEHLGTWSNALASYSAVWTNALADASGAPLAVTLPRLAWEGAGRLIDFDIFSNSSELNDKVFGPANFVQRILIIAILTAAFWLSYNLLIPRIFELYQGAAQATSGGPVQSVFGMVIKIGLKTLIIELGTLALAYLPSIATGVMDGLSWSPLSATSFTSNISGNGGLDGSSGIMTNIAKRYYHMLGEFIPWATLWVTIVNFLAFRLLIDQAALFAWAFIRALSFGVALVVLGGVGVEGATVRFENWVGSSVGVSNSWESVSIEPGVTTLPMEAGMWQRGGSNVFELVETGAFDPLPVVRASNGFSGTNSVIQFAVYDAPSVQMGVWWGWWTGLTVFGFAWTVAVVRKSVTIGVRNWE